MKLYTIKIANIVVAYLVLIILVGFYIKWIHEDSSMEVEEEKWYGNMEERVEYETTVPMRFLPGEYDQEATTYRDVEEYKSRLREEGFIRITDALTFDEVTTFAQQTTHGVTKSPIEIAQRFQERFDRMRSVCPITSRDDIRRKVWVFNDNFLVDLEKKLLVCAVPKAGNSNWHMLLWKLRRQMNGLPTDANLYSYNDTIENTNIARGVRGSEGKKLIFFQEGIDDKVFSEKFNPASHRVISVRHPFSRLISGWNQKFHKESEYWKDLYVRYPLLKQFKEEDDETHEMSFSNFANFVVKYGSDDRELDFHFKTASGVCKPCGYVYSYVVKAKTFDEDVGWIKNKLDIGDVVIGRNGVGPQTSGMNSQNVIQKYMGMLSTKVIKQLMEIYKLDFDLFGYTFDPYTLDAGGFE